MASSHGPPLLEPTYEQYPAHELKLNGIGFLCLHPPPVDYKVLHLECGCHNDSYSGFLRDLRVLRGLR